MVHIAITLYFFLVASTLVISFPDVVLAKYYPDNQGYSIDWTVSPTFIKATQYLDFSIDVTVTKHSGPPPPSPQLGYIYAPPPYGIVMSGGGNLDTLAWDSDYADEVTHFKYTFKANERGHFKIPILLYVGSDIREFRINNANDKQIVDVDVGLPQSVAPVGGPAPDTHTSNSNFDSGLYENVTEFGSGYGSDNLGNNPQLDKGANSDSSSGDKGANSDSSSGDKGANSDSSSGDKGANSDSSSGDNATEHN
jgi:hypothetical protein